jgi:hypothetical protein
MAAALTVASLVLAAAGTAPARAEFFGCNDHSRVVSSTNWHRTVTRQQTTHYSGIFASHPRQQRVYYSSVPRYSHYR